MGPKCPQWVPNGSKMGPQWSTMGPKCPQWVPNGSKMGPKLRSLFAFTGVMVPRGVRTRASSVPCDAPGPTPHLKGSKRGQKERASNGPKRAQRVLKRAPKAPKGAQRGPKRAQRGKICPKYCQYCMKTGQGSQNSDMRHNYARGWSLRQHIGLK